MIVIYQDAEDGEPPNIVYDEATEGFYNHDEVPDPEMPTSFHNADFATAYMHDRLNGDPLEALTVLFNGYQVPNYLENERNKIDKSTDIARVQETTPLFKSESRTTTVKMVTGIQVSFTLFSLSNFRDTSLTVFQYVALSPVTVIIPTTLLDYLHRGGVARIGIQRTEDETRCLIHG